MPLTSHAPDAVLIAPDGCTKYLAAAVERDLDDMAEGAVLEVRFEDDLAGRIDLATWCLGAGKQILNPFDHWRVEHLLIHNTAIAA